MTRKFDNRLHLPTFGQIFDEIETHLITNVELFVGVKAKAQCKLTLITYYIELLKEIFIIFIKILKK